MSNGNDLLPKSLVVNGTEYEIRSDYRDIREINIAARDTELTNAERAEVVLTIFYPALETMPSSDYQEALDKLSWFICGGRQESDNKKKLPQIVDWEKDFQYIVSPINRIIGREIRGMKSLHWWTFLAAWNEIPPDCLWAQIVRIRNKKAKNMPLDKGEAEWYRENRDMVDITPAYTRDDMDFLAQFAGQKGGA